MKRYGWHFWVVVLVSAFGVDFLDEMNGGHHTMAALIFGAVIGFLLARPRGAE